MPAQYRSKNDWDDGLYGPALFIGIGGSGLRIIEETKWRLLGRWGVIPPTMQFACFDTAEIEVDTKVGRNMVLNREDVLFLEGYLRDILPNLHGYPHITEWFDVEKTPYDIDLPQSPSQNRTIGRLMFFWNFDAIEKKLNDCLADIKIAADIEKAQLANDDSQWYPGMKVFIACSLCGGTGSAMFLDFAYLIRHLAGVNSSLKTTGYFVLDNAFPFGGGITANLFAAMKELDHFMSQRQPRFEAQYTPDLKVEIPGLPFDNCYLIDAMNQGGKNIRKEDLFRAASESMLIRLGGKVHAKYLGIEVCNTACFDPEVFTNENNRKKPIFRTFGCSFLRLPVPDLIDYCANRLSAAVTKTLISQDADSERAETMAGEFFRQSKVPSSDEAMNQALATKNGKPLTIILNPRLFDDTPSKNKLLELQAKMASEGFQQIRTTNLEAINENKDRIIGEAKIEIERCVDEILATSGEGAGFAVNFLQALQDKNLIVQERDNLAKLGKAKELIDGLATDINSTRQDLSTRANRILVTDKSLNRIFTGLLTKQSNLLTYELQRSIREAEDLVIKSLKAHVEDLLMRSEKYRTNLRELNRRTNSIVVEYESSPFTVDASYSFNLLEPKNYGLIYDFEMDEIPFDSEPSAVETFITGVENGWLGLSAEEVGEKITGFARQAFSDLRKVDIEVFIKKHEEMFDADDILNSLATFSLPLLSINTQKLITYDLPKRINILSVPVPEDALQPEKAVESSIFADNYKTIGGEIKELTELELIPGDDETQITLYQERTNIPLLSILTLRKCEAAYNNRKDKGFNLHLRKEYADFESVFSSDIDEKIVLKMALAEVFGLIEKDVYGKYFIARVIKDKEGNEATNLISYSQSRELIQQTLQENKEAHDFVVQRINEELENRGKGEVKPMIDNYMENLDITGPETQLNKIIYDQLEEYLENIKPLV